MPLSKLLHLSKFKILIFKMKVQEGQGTSKVSVILGSTYNAGSASVMSTLIGAPHLSSSQAEQRQRVDLSLKVTCPVP